MSRLQREKYLSAESDFADAAGISVASRTVHVPILGTDIRVLETGQGSPVLFLHGSPNNAAGWFTMAAQMQGFRCLLMDLPGHGLSTSVNKWTNHRANTVSVVETVLDDLELNQVDLVANSLGGVYAYNFVAARSDRVRRIVQMGAPSGPEILPKPWIERLLSLPVLPSLLLMMMKPDEKKARKMFHDIGHEPTVESGVLPDEMFKAYSALLKYTDTLQGMIDEVRVMTNLRGHKKNAKVSAETLSSITAPMLYLWGDSDPFASPTNGDDLSSISPNANIEHFEGFGHLPWLDDVELISERVTEFLTQPRS